VWLCSTKSTLAIAEVTTVICKHYLSFGYISMSEAELLNTHTTKSFTQLNHQFHLPRKQAPPPDAHVLEIPAEIQGCWFESRTWPSQHWAWLAKGTRTRLGGGCLFGTQHPRASWFSLWAAATAGCSKRCIHGACPRCRADGLGSKSNITWACRNKGRKCGYKATNATPQAILHTFNP